MYRMKNDHFQIRDPIHGVIFISQQERAVIDTLAFQRLRNIKQVGFADFAFPCATHSRYAHSLGAMCVASKVFERIIDPDEVQNGDMKKMRQAVRLAALLHDIGHPPLSHTTEMLMPSLSKLTKDASSTIKATHEDYTLKIILDSEVASVITENFAEMGVTPQMVASLINKDCNAELFMVAGLDYSPVLKQIISSEIDADRMDYLLRDSFFCGVNYGKYDSDWLMENLVSVVNEGRVYLGIKARAIFAFEDFLLSRYHMFASVYLHHTPVIMEKMLERFFIEEPTAFSLPAAIDEYLALDDLDLWHVLRKSRNQWAERIVRRRPYVVLVESFGGFESDDNKNYDGLLAALDAAHIDTIISRSKSVLSTYFTKVKNPLFVYTAQQKAVPLEEFSQVFMRYRTPAELFRIFVDASQKAHAAQIMKSEQGKKT